MRNASSLPDMPITSKSPSARGRRGFALSDKIQQRAYFLCSMAAWAAESLAIGTRNGEQDT